MYYKAKSPPPAGRPGVLPRGLPAGPSRRHRRRRRRPQGHTIKPVLAYVLHDTVRNQVPHRDPFPDSLTAVRRRDRHGRHLHQRDPVTGDPGVTENVPGTRHPHQMSQVEDLLTVLPGEDLRQRVRPGDEVQFRARVLSRDVMKGVDRVGRTTPVDIDPGDCEPRVGGRGDHRHEVTVLGRGDLALLLEGLGPGGHEDDLVESEDVLNLAGRDQVSMVDRVKGSPHDADAKRTSRQGHALRLASLLGDTIGSPQTGLDNCSWRTYCHGLPPLWVSATP